MSLRRSVIRLVACVVGGLAVLPVASAQDDSKPWKLDPYTDNEPAALQAAGYVRYGTLDMPWGEGHATEAVELALGQVPMLWVETAHFRLGCSLPEYKLTKAEKASIQAELKQLKTTLPTVRPKVKQLDRWLRCHLYAMRLESLYADFCELLGVTDADFPSPDGQPRDPPASRGPGPFLGQRGKFLVLLTEKRSTLARYGQRFGNVDSQSPLRLNFPEQGSLFFGSSVEFFKGDLDNDTAFHCHVVWNVVQDLALGYKGYMHLTPRWWSEGLGHVFLRRVNPEYPSYSQMSDPSQLALEQWDYPPKVRARVKYDIHARAEELLRWPRTGPRSLSDNIMMWSRVDYLVSERPDDIGPFMDRLKDPIPVEPGTAPTEQDVFARQDEALQEAFQLDAEGFDEAWAAWVLKTYRKR